MNKHHEHRSIGLGMRVALWLQAIAIESFTMRELSERLVTQYGISRASAYRYLQIGFDVLGIHAFRNGDGNRKGLRRLRNRPESVYGVGHG